MKLLTDLFSTDYGLMSITGIVFMMGMGGVLSSPVHGQDETRSDGPPRVSRQRASCVVI